MTREVGMLFGGVAAPVGNERLFVRLIVKLVAPEVASGTVITTGDQVEATPAVVDTDAGFNAAHVAPVAVPQK
jgi:hypothetical protein